MDKKLILLVEDEPIIALSQKRQLESYGYSVTHVSTGEDALKIMGVGACSDISIILMDINLGQGLSGPETAKIILSQCSIPIVFVSSHTEKEVVEKTEKITSYGYVVKNSGITVLDAAIKMALKLFEAKIKIEKERQRYKDFFTQSPCAIAIHEIVLDKNGKPIDYIFLAVNESFEKRTGLKKEDIIHKRCREVIPGIEQKWIDIYGEVVLTGETKFFTERADPLNKSFNVKVYRNAPHQFTCMFMDVE